MAVPASTAGVVMFMLRRGRDGGLIGQAALQVALHCGERVALPRQQSADASLAKLGAQALAHAAADEQVDTVQRVWAITGPMVQAAF